MRASTTGGDAPGVRGGGRKGCVWGGDGEPGWAALTATIHLPISGSTTTCSCGSPQTCFPAPPPSLPASQAPRAAGRTTSTSRCASRPSSWVGGAPVGSWPRAEQSWGGPSRAPSHSLLGLTPDSDSDEEDAHFFSVGASGAPQAAPRPPSPRSQSSFSTLVTVLKGRVTALCEAKVRADGQGDQDWSEQRPVGDVGNRPRCTRLTPPAPPSHPVSPLLAPPECKASRKGSQWRQASQGDSSPEASAAPASGESG